MSDQAAGPERVLPGKSFPLGSVSGDTGTNFALFSEHASSVTLCLFDDAGAERQLPLTEVTAHIWHGFVPGVGPGQQYGYRVSGPYAPGEGHRFNPAKLLIDPYAKALAGSVDWNQPVFAYAPSDNPEADSIPDDRDSAAGMPKSLVIDPAFDWEDTHPPDTPMHRSVVYEMHVKGFTERHPEIDPELRGTYAGVAHPASVQHLRELGITAVELLPVHAFVSGKHLIDLGLTNYWGYNTIGFFAPDAKYSSSGDRGGQVREFKEMVKALHKAGIEVILDVVYNHTAEGNQLGPNLCFRGIDNASYYWLVEGDPRSYMDYTGTGNTLNARNPQVLQLIMDSLRYWALEMHVDGFRFDLASALARELYDVDQLSAFFDIIHQDPVISQVKLIAEPWDVGEGGYQVGRFPVLWAEWNGRYRDAVRGFWRGDDRKVAEMAYRLTGSSDMYQQDGRRPSASINFVTAHDGFTLADLVSYEHKHNEANGEENRDGNDHALSMNFGIEGPTDDPGIRELRARQQRTMLATLLLSQGVPMITAGDEMGRTQQGNNNAYCQDNEISWINWELDEANEQLLRFTKRLIELRAENPSLHRRKFFQEREIHGLDVRDVLWHSPNGSEMSDEQWNNAWVRTLGMQLTGGTLDVVDEHGAPLSDDALLVLLNAFDGIESFTLPERPIIVTSGAQVSNPSPPEGAGWKVLIDTANPNQDAVVIPPGGNYSLQSRTLALFRWVPFEPQRTAPTGG